MSSPSLKLFSLFVYCANCFPTKGTDLPNPNLTLFRAVGKESALGGGELTAGLAALPQAPEQTEPKVLRAAVQPWKGSVPSCECSNQQPSKAPPWAFTCICWGLHTVACCNSTDLQNLKKSQMCPSIFIWMNKGHMPISISAPLTGSHLSQDGSNPLVILPWCSGQF